MMAKPFRALREKMSPAAQQRVADKAQAIIRDMPLDELRSARNLTQEQLAKALGVEQAAVSRMERRTDMYVSTLQTAIRAMGGDLEIRAVFPDGTVRIDQFRDIERSATKPLKRRSAGA
jgi:transcriptional regulator with XRE-family HTH domain